VNYGVEVFGDRWSLLIIRDIVFCRQEDVWRVPEIGGGNRDQCPCFAPCVSWGARNSLEGTQRRRQAEGLLHADREGPGPHSRRA